MTKVLLLAGPSCSGKTTISGALCALPEFTRVLTATTRQPRVGESLDAYLFMEEAEFRAHVSTNQFLEYALVHGNYYGTPKATVQKALASGKNPVLIVDVQGAESLRYHNLPILSIFLAPPEPWKQTLLTRLTNRRDEPSAISTRLQNAEFEMTRRHQFEHVIVNDKTDETVAKIRALVE